jgi:hypothetical protein
MITEITSAKDLIYYGPHKCHRCDKIICKVAVEQGGEEYDYPEGPIYPNTDWVLHVCEGSTNNVQ